MTKFVKPVALMYHDAFTGSDCDASGFPGKGAAVYKMEIGEMERHFGAIAQARSNKPARATSPHDHGNPLFLTFDDGGVSAATLIADLLEKFDWAGHFFVAASLIDTPTFVTRKQLQELHARGHVIGSHSWSHPTRMSSCTSQELDEEWSRSLVLLSEIVAEPVSVASVPGGYFSREVARAASRAGIRTLFTSEPNKRAYYVDDCLVLGRYTIMRDTPAEVSASLASVGPTVAQAKQSIMWKVKKVAKTIGGRLYLTIRERLIGD